MVGEGTLALASLIAAVAGISLVSQCDLPSVGIVSDLNWHIYYDTWENATTNKATAFVLGGGALIESIGIPAPLAKTIMAVLVISFAATTLDTATRIQRFILMELGDASHIKPLQNRYTATLIAILPALALTFSVLTVTKTTSLLSHPAAEYPVTEYVVVLVGLTSILAVSAPVFHR